MIISNRGLVERHLTTRIVDSLGAARIVNIVGPRQVGKSTTVEHQVPIAEYLTMDDDALRAAIELDPHAVLADYATRHKETGKPIAIDEIQRVPSITLALKRIVDSNRAYGQFLLTGSSNIFAGSKAADSLAGRVRTLKLSPLSAAEILAARPCLLLDAVMAHPDGVPIDALPAAVPCPRADAIDLMVRGGFPEIRGLLGRERRSRYLDYLNSIIEKDVPPVAEIRKTAELRKFLLQLGARTAQELSINAMCDAVGVNWRTMSLWYDVLSQLGIVHHLPAWTSSRAKREIKASKIHMMDTGCAAAIRNEVAESFMPAADPAALGAIMETFVFVELDKSLPLVNDSWELYHWRRQDHEIDIIAEAPGNRLALFEIKASTAVALSDFRHMDWFFAGPASAYSGTAFVVYLGDRILPFGPRKIALPLSLFWSYR